jgi:uncharacterized protein YjbI with pentapeptide repeats
MSPKYAGRTLRGRPFKEEDDLVGADFRRATLRGVDFKNLNLSEADFSGADICGANFSNAILVDTIFSGAVSGLQKRWIFLQIVSAFLISATANVCAILLNGAIAGSLFNPTFTKGFGFLPGIFVTLLMIFTYLALSIEGFSTRGLVKIVSIGAVVGAILGHIASSISDSKGLGTGKALTAAGVFLGAIVVTVTLAVASVGAVSVSVAVAVADAYALGAIVLAAGVVVCALVAADIFAGMALDRFTGVLVIVDAFAVLLLNLYICRRVLKEDEKFTVIRTVGIDFGSWGGTIFCGANLSRAVFARATLKNTNFNSSEHQSTQLTHVDWTEARYLNRAGVHQSILANRSVRELLVTRRGHDKNYCNANLIGANLTGVDLKAANLQQANLNNAILHRTHLENANLREATVIGADFTGAYLTGACIEAWDLDATTALTKVDCQYIFLLEKPNTSGDRERCPKSGSFAPGEFTKRFQKLLHTIVLIFEDGIEWKAFVTAFKTLQDRNQDTELSIQSVENNGDGGVVVQVNASLNANKEKIRSEFNQNYEAALKALESKYQAELQAKDNEIAHHREKYSDLKEISMLMAQQPINVTATAESKSMNDSTDSSRNVEIDNRGGTFNASGSALNLGDISGTVTNILNQLQSANHPNAPQLADLLQQLQTAINNEPTLPDEGKAEALTEVNVLAEAGKNPQKETQKEKANLALKILNKMIAVLPSTATLVESCSKLLPAIVKLLGL